MNNNNNSDDFSPRDDISKRSSRTSNSAHGAGDTGSGQFIEGLPDHLLDRPEFDVEEADDQEVPVACGGIIWDVEELQSIVDVLSQRDFDATQHFIARWVTIVFVIWTCAGVLDLLVRNSPWLLMTDLGPGALFEAVVWEYFRKKREQREMNEN